MSTIEPELQTKMMQILQIEEGKTDLEDLAVLSRVGMKVASAESAELDADAISASSTALIDLGLRLAEATYHGALREILLRNQSGYIVLMAINDEYIVFGGLRKTERIGYYLGYLREMAKKLNRLISGDEETEMAITLEQSELEKLRQQREIEEQEEALRPKKPSVEQDKAALDDLLGFLDDWEKEGVDVEDLEADTADNIVSIPKSMTIGITGSGGSVGIPEDMGALETKTETKMQSGFEIYDDEVPPVPLDDYTPMDVEEATQEAEAPATPIKDLPPLEDLPSFDELSIPNFDTGFDAAEYDTDFVLEEESGALDSVLKELGWDEED